MWDFIADNQVFLDITGFVKNHIFIFLFCVTVAAVICSLFFGLRRAWKLFQWSRKCGLKFSMWHESDFKIRHPGFRCLNSGQRQCAYNICRGRWSGWDVWAFDYKHTVQTLSGTNETKFSGILAKPSFRLKPLRIRPENFGDRLADFMGRGDIDFESAEFSEKFYVNAIDRKWAYDVLHVRAIEYLLKSQADRFMIQFSDSEVLLTKLNGSRMKPHEFETALTIATNMLAMIPDYARHE